MLRSCLRSIGHQSWLRFGIRDRILRFFDPPDRSVDTRFDVPFFGKRYYGSFASFIDWSVFYYGCYAPAEIRLLDDILRTLKAPIVIDVGANVGHHSLFFSTRAYRVIAFEPYPPLISRWKEQMCRNAVTNCELHEVALGHEDTVTAYTPPTPGTCNLGVGSFLEPSAGSENVLLPIRHGDRMLQTAAVARIDFIKIDTEGFEPFVLLGLAGTLARSRPIVFFEWSAAAGSGAPHPEPLRLLPDGYKLFLCDFGVHRGPICHGAYRLHPWGDHCTARPCHCLAVPTEKLGVLSHIVSASHRDSA